MKHNQRLPGRNRPEELDKSNAEEKTVRSCENAIHGTRTRNGKYTIMNDRKQAALQAKLRQRMPPDCTLSTAWKSWQPRILAVYLSGPLGYTPPMLPSFMDNVKLDPVATAWEEDEHGDIQRIHLLEVMTPAVLKIAEVRQWLEQRNLDITVTKKGGNYVFVKNGHPLARYKVKEATFAQLDEFKTELPEIETSQPRYDEKQPMADHEKVWAGYTYLVDGQPTQAPRTTTVGDWLKCCPPGSVISKCDVFAQGLATRKCSCVRGRT